MEIITHYPARRVMNKNGPVLLKEVLDELQLSFDYVLVLRNGVLVGDADMVLLQDDKIKIYPAICGG